MNLRNLGDADNYLARLQRGTDTVLDLSLCQSEACKHWNIGGSYPKISLDISFAVS